jgi:hypothetical protein
MKYLLFFALLFTFSFSYSQSDIILNEEDSTYQISETEILTNGWTRTMISPRYPDSLLALSIEQKADALTANLKTQNEQLQADSIELKKQSDALKARTGKDYSEKIAEYLDKNLEGDWVLRDDTTKYDLTFREGKFRQKGDDNFPIQSLSKTAFLLRKFIKEDIYFEEITSGRWVGKSGENKYILKRD